MRIKIQRHPVYGGGARSRGARVRAVDWVDVGGNDIT